MEQGTGAVLITGGTDGIGLDAARRLKAAGATVWIHGRNADKLARVGAELSLESSALFKANLADLQEVTALGDALAERGADLSALINNAGVLKTPKTRLPDGADIRFVVNTVAPYALTRRLEDALRPGGRVINISSAAQAPVDLAALTGGSALDDMAAYAQSKLALILWTRHLAAEYGAAGPMVVAVNPGSLLATKMVTEGFGISGNDVGIGGEILRRAALSDEFSDAGGRYYDTDAGAFGTPHAEALDPAKCADATAAIDRYLRQASA
ncbi:MAG: SDR family NAD(P)-dependent oxidoreductase [Pseudomonadota bacterium]